MVFMCEELSPEELPQAALVGAAALPTMLPRLWVFALRLSGNEKDAEALVQRACARALDQIDHLDPGLPPLVKVIGLVVDIWTNEHSARSRRARIRIPRRNVLPSDIGSGARDVVTISSYRWIVQRIEQMSDPQRIAMLLVYVEQFSYQETAIVMRVPVRTVNAYLSHALQTVARSLETDRPKRRFIERATDCVRQAFRGLAGRGSASTI